MRCMADQTIDHLQMTLEDVIRIICLARHTANDKTLFLFQQNLADEKIPWFFSDERFLEKVQKLKEALTVELNLQNEETTRRVAEKSFSSTFSPEEREGMLVGFKEIWEQEKSPLHTLFQYTESLANTYVERLKNKGVLLNEQEPVVKRKIIQTIRRVLEQNDVSDLSKQIIKTAISLNITDSVASSAAEAIAIPPEVTNSLSKISWLSETTKLVLLHGDEVEKGELLQLCLTNPGIPPALIAEKNNGKLQATKILVLSDDVKQKINNTLNNSNKRQLMFEQAAISAKQGISQPINDIVTAISGPQGKEFISNIIDTVLGAHTKE